VVTEYGQCGVGVYCLGGCDPQFSNTLDSCVPAPICQNQNYNFTSLDGIVPETKYLGNASTASWISTGEPVVYTDPGSGQNQVLLTMAEGTVGTLLASAEYVWYGNIKCTMKSSRGAGVVTAFIMLSDVKDEIDFEFVGVALGDVQSNYYWQADPICMYDFCWGEGIIS
jgi:beta-glucanase (GH16 family)